MKKIWIVEKHLFPEYENELKDAIISSGESCYMFDDTKHTFNFDKNIKEKFTNQDWIIFYGSLQRGRQILKETDFLPGIFLTLENYECYKYYSYYGDNMVNDNYLFLSFNDIIRNKNKIFDFFKTESIFIRPSNGYKTFTGQLLHKDNFEKELDTLSKSYGGIDVDQLVLLSSYKKICEESRFVVVNKNGSNSIIDGNVYMINNELVKHRKVDECALIYANSIIDKYTPDKAFTIDIAKLEDGSYKVLEIGSFCCAGLYNMDIEKVVNGINDLLEYEYKDYWNLI